MMQNIGSMLNTEKTVTSFFTLYVKLFHKHQEQCHVVARSTIRKGSKHLAPLSILNNLLWESCALSGTITAVWTQIYPCKQKGE